jgi:Tol biopolymer transport system component
VLEFVLLLLAGVGLFGGGAFTGHWFRGRQTEPPAPTWKGDLLLGTMSRVMAPRVSPDGQALAFAALLGPASHVGVMKIASVDWTVLTRRSGPGTIGKVCWSRDGNKIYFDRVSDVPHGIFSVPPLGGEERLVLDEAEGPEANPSWPS